MMSRQQGPAKGDVSRRQFLKRSSLAVAGAAAIEAPLVHTAYAAGAGANEIKIGLIGCGGRGTGATANALGAATKVIYPASGYHTENMAAEAKVAKANIKVVALADVFEDRLNDCRTQLTRLGVDVPKKSCFVGFDAYQKLLAMPEVNYVILATPPHFRPQQLKAAVEAGKNVFMEKPAAVDVPGVKTVIEAGELARQKGLGIAAGTQRRHQRNYRETIQRIHDGAIGEIVYARCYWNGGEIWVIDRKPGWSDMEWQLRNWNYFTWLSGDHICEQHVHNLDIMNWVLGAHPIRAVSGLGGRQVRTGSEYGQIFDHFAVEFEYPDDVRMFSQCRQINDCDNLVEEAVVGTGGKSNCKSIIRPKKGSTWRYRKQQVNAYQQEHADLIASIRAGTPINEARAIAESTMTGILGREAVYSGKTITWDAAMQSTRRLGPQQIALGPYPTPPVAMPGRYRFL
jgi:myo-inositol 2-dehydrogenase/D-chiro-inositol 1-dehydrogenase